MARPVCGWACIACAFVLVCREARPFFGFLVPVCLSLHFCLHNLQKMIMTSWYERCLDCVVMISRKACTQHWHVIWRELQSCSHHACFSTFIPRACVKVSYHAHLMIRTAQMHATTGWEEIRLVQLSAHFVNPLYK